MASDSSHSLSREDDSHSDGTSKLANRTSLMNTDPPVSVLDAVTDVVRKDYWVECLSGCVLDRDRHIRRCVCLLCVVQSVCLCCSSPIYCLCSTPCLNVLDVRLCF